MIVPPVCRHNPKRQTREVIMTEMKQEVQTPDECTHVCDTCGADCPSRAGGEQAADRHEKLNEHSNVRKVIGVVSGKGGVGKSMVTALSAVAASRNGYKVGILDADITGPSIPKMFGIKDKAMSSEFGILPGETSTGIKVMSLNLLTENESDPVVWRGPVIAGAVTQFWTEVVWGDLDVMFIDMPPGTGDVPLTVFQSLPVDGILIVTSPQELVSMIVEKAAKMAKMMDIPILGIVENMSYLACPDCGKRIEVFGPSHAAEVAERSDLKLLAQLPIDTELAGLSDKGKIEFAENAVLTETILSFLEEGTAETR